MNVTIYVKNGDVATYNAFKKVCHREGVSVSEKIVKWIYEYMAVHGEGNPQTVLDYAGEVQTLPKWKTCRWSQGVQVQGDVYCDPRVKSMPPYWRPVTACEKCAFYKPRKAREKEGSP